MNFSYTKKTALRPVKEKYLLTFLLGLLVSAAFFLPYMLMSEAANTELIGNVFYDRVPLTMKDEILVPSQNLRWSGRARYSCGYYNWRQIILGGAATGTTLEI